MDPWCNSTRIKSHLSATWVPREFRDPSWVRFLRILFGSRDGYWQIAIYLNGWGGVGRHRFWIFVTIFGQMAQMRQRARLKHSWFFGGLGWSFASLSGGHKVCLEAFAEGLGQSWPDVGCLWCSWLYVVTFFATGSQESRNSDAQGKPSQVYRRYVGRRWKVNLRILLPRDWQAWGCKVRISQDSELVGDVTSA
jgi:hypothetical protein